MLPATHRTVIAKELGECQKKMNKETGLAPDNRGTYEMNEVSESRGLRLAYMEC